MKENSPNQSSFLLVLALIIYLFMGLITGKEPFLGIIMWIIISALVIFLFSVVVVSLQIIKDKKLKDENEKETLSD